jgi:hypothetical protein
MTIHDTPEAVLAAAIHARFCDFGFDTCEEDAAAILAALVDWTLVPRDVWEWEHPSDADALIARLRAMLIEVANLACEDRCAVDRNSPPEDHDQWHQRVFALATAPSEPERPICPICHRTILTEAHGGGHPSPGDHDPAAHAVRAYGTSRGA